MAQILDCIGKLIDYGIQTGLVAQADRMYTVNRLLELFKLDATDDLAQVWTSDDNLSVLLGEMCDYAFAHGLMEEDSVTWRDLFDTKIMGLLTPPPSQVISDFRKRYASSPEEATTAYYQMNLNNNYIRRDRISKDRKWKVATEYGELDITINLSKPEKDPKAIAAAKNARQSGYPKCQLCWENEGYAGRPDHPARQNLRVIPVEMQDGLWGFQYSPYVYYNEHCIVFNARHVPMKIERSTFCRLFDFVRQFPHYFVGSNADLPIVGGSILSHDHFQGGNYTFAMARAKIERHFSPAGFEDIEAGVVAWPMSVIRLRGETPDRMIELGDRILKKWRAYSDPEAFVYAETDGQPHNTITPIARKNGEKYELDLVLRNNITTAEHPLGVFHPHADLHHIKKENIGLIEVMGLAVLPARLKEEFVLLADALVEGKAVCTIPEIEKHAGWADALRAKYARIDAGNVMPILEQETGRVFLRVLEDAGVFKRTAGGQAAFDRFLETV